ncbi:hypothetical protein [Planctomyces sp. SH-PL14]|uniref:hypothetical protein n=1 Tax=Planctomyces sp. SH-PL14 TaxID=1632864 RepID=UPI0012E7046E|nr:hypothetical protein [Planctomyces sp. SH-PL14]
MMGRWVLCAVLLLAGCGAKPKVTEGLKAVTGKITYKDQPVTSGVVTFYTDRREGMGATGNINPDGTYSLQTNANSPGAKPGAYKIRIESWSVPPKVTDDAVVPGKSAIPEKYGNVEQSGLTATVKEDASQTIDFKLVD